MVKSEQDSKFLELAEKWLNGTITPEEEKEYAEWYNTIDADVILEIPSSIATDSEQHRQKIFQQLLSRKVVVIPFYKKFTRQIAAAAVFVSVIGAGLYFFNNDRLPVIATAPPDKSQLLNDIRPGTYGAILTLSNGKTISLDTAQNGKILPASGIAVIKTDRSLTFKTGSTRNTPIEFYTLSTPRGRQQQLVLPDGTAVWLNAQSSIRFPAVFSGANRKVDMSGEAFFEVAKDISRPFLVRVNEAEIKVLGTHFNVMGYSNETMLETTLVEGSVKFSNGDYDVQLRPGQQGQLLANSKIRVVDQANLEQVLAWKNGIQSFSNADIKTIMRQVERWYDVDVEYKRNITTRKFSGEIPRDVNLSELLKLFEINKIHFQIDAEHKKMIVMP